MSFIYGRPATPAGDPGTASVLVPVPVPVALPDAVVGPAAKERGRPVLDHFDLSIAGGEVVAVVGATGSGKTTVLSLLARLYDPQAGTVTLDGVDVRRLSLPVLRQAVAVVFEDSFLFNDTIAVNLRVGRPQATDEEFAAAAHLAQADEFIDELPLGYDTPVGERGFGPVRRPTPAHRLGPRPARRPPGPGPGRRHLLGGRAPGAGGGAGSRRRPGRQDDDHHFPSPGHHRRGRPGGAGRGRPSVAAGTHEELVAISERYRQVLSLEHLEDQSQPARVHSGTPGPGK